jgi:hypothetical protein
MDTKNLKTKVQYIVEKATNLKNKHIDDKNAPVNYACIFAQSKAEYRELLDASNKLGKVLEEMPGGVLFQISPLETVSGPLQILKIRVPDVTRPELGDADFTIPNYLALKKKYLGKPGWSLIRKREDFEMLELIDPKFDVRVYFSNPPLDVQLNIK